MQSNMNMITLTPQIKKEKTKAISYTKSSLLEAKFTMTTYCHETYTLKREGGVGIRGKGDYNFFLQRQRDTNTKSSTTVILATATAYSFEINCTATDRQVDIANLHGYLKG